MSIVVAVITENGAVMASESRRIEYKANDPDNFTIIDDCTPKIHILDNRICLGYAGVGSVKVTGWTLDREIADLQKMAGQGDSIGKLAHHFKDRLDKALSGLPETVVKYGFLMTTYYNNSILVGYESFNGGPIVELGHAAPEGFKAGAWYSGEIGIIKKLLSGEEIDYAEMTLDQAVEFVNMTLTAGFTCLKYFKGCRQVSGGPINLAIVTPEYCGFLQPTKEFLTDQLVAALQENKTLKRKVALLEGGGAEPGQCTPPAGI